MLYKSTARASQNFLAEVVRENRLLSAIRTVVELLFGLLRAALQPLMAECMTGTLLEDVSYA